MYTEKGCSDQAPYAPRMTFIPARDPLVFFFRIFGRFGSAGRWPETARPAAGTISVHRCHFPFQKNSFSYTGTSRSKTIGLHKKFSYHYGSCLIDLIEIFNTVQKKLFFIFSFMLYLNLKMWKKLFEWEK